MSSADPLPYRATLEEHQQEAEALFGALKSADEAAEWRFKWLHPRFRGQSVTDVRAATLDVTDAQVVVARECGFESWADLAEFTDAVSRDGPVERFEAAVEALVSGQVAALRSMLRDSPELVRALDASTPCDATALRRRQRRRGRTSEDTGECRRGRKDAARRRRRGRRPGGYVR